MVDKSHPGAGQRHSTCANLLTVHRTTENKWRALLASVLVHAGLLTFALTRAPDVSTQRTNAAAPIELVILDVPDYRQLFYHFGVSHVWRVVKRGRVVYAAGAGEDAGRLAAPPG